MRIAAMIAAAAMVGMAANEELSDPKVTAAILRAWEQTRNGLSRNEAGFRLDARRAGYEIVEVASTNQFSAQSLPIIPGVTFALFHVHPSQADPAPSEKDRMIADQFSIRIFTIHALGVFVYDPGTRKTLKLRNGTGWMR
jgi:hypothetical protein